jgi:adenylate cyclase
MLVWLEPAPFAGLSHQIHDALLSAQAVPPRAGAVVMVDIDDASLSRLGQWPWSRRELGRLVDNLWRQGAAVVVFDMVFPEADRTSPILFESSLRREFGPGVAVTGIPSEALDHDTDFAAALARGRSLMGCYFALGAPHDGRGIIADAYHHGHCFETGRPQRDMLPQGITLIQSLPVLRSRATGEASFNTLADRDNVIRRTPLLVAYGPNRIYPALSLEALRLFRGASNIRVGYDNQLGRGVASVDVGGLSLPTDANGCLVLNFRSTPFPRISAWKVLDGGRDVAAVSNRVVLIGTSAAGLHDLKATPLASDLPGIEVHATALDNMLAGDALREPRWMFHANLLAVAVAGLAMIVLMASSRSWHAFIAAAGFIVMALATSTWALASYRLVVSPVGMAVGIILVYTSMTVVKYWQEERERHRIRTMFTTMVSTDVLRLMEENPGSFSLAGRKAEVTVLFSDIANFTQLAENLDPDVLTKLINRYLTEMTGIIMARGGYVDKFYGDAIMAVWGAPYAIPDHAHQACLTALEQLARLAVLNRDLSVEFGCELEIRIGINTGVVTAGNMGSANRFQYTVMGDAVNVASRLEAANRLCGTRILIGEGTLARVQGQVETRQIGWVQIRGKTKPVLLYELLARQGELPPATTRVIALYDQALAAYHARRWDEALQLTQHALSLKADDGPARLLRDNALHCKNIPPPDHWGHVLDMGS